MEARKGAPCRLCGDTTYLRDDEGPVHECCQAWRKAIKLGYPCPSCAVARIVLRQDAEMRRRIEGTGNPDELRQVRLPTLRPLPRFFPDGSPFVPEASPAPAALRSIVGDATAEGGR